MDKNNADERGTPENRANGPVKGKEDPDRKARRRNGTFALVCLAFVGGMVGASYAAVPLYTLFCRVTGYGGTTQRAEAGPVAPIARTIEVRFDGNVAGGLPWTFRPEQRQIDVKMGEVTNTQYLVVNNAEGATAGNATYNVAPFAAGSYFNKIDCFCFNEQDLKAGEKRDMGVVFFIDPEMDKDPQLKHVRTITLSYTFFPAKPSSQPVAAADRPSDDVSGNL